MKKAILFAITIMLILGLVLSGCSHNTTTTATQSKFCRVLCIKGDGIVVWAENIGNIYVKQIDASLQIAPLETVVMEFSESTLEPATGTFTDAFGEEQHYLFILDAPASIRYTTEDEPTFG